MSIFYENDTENIENCPRFHEPEWVPTGDDGEFESKGSNIPGTVPADEPSDDAEHSLGEFTSSIFYETDSNMKPDKISKEKEKKGEENNIPPKKDVKNESGNILDYIKLI